MVTILSLIPSSVNGLGVKESSSVFFAIRGVKTETTISAYLIANLIVYTFAILMIIIVKTRRLNHIQRQIVNS